MEKKTFDLFINL